MHHPLDEFRQFARSEGRLSRRVLMGYGAALASVPMLGRAASGQAHPKFATDPFTVGVASGDPASDGAVIWTRLAPKPLEPFGGMGRDAVQVHWKVAEDEAGKRVVDSGIALATPQLGHSVHVELHGLKPDRWYWYQFQAGDAKSPMGRLRTLPAADAMPDRLKFAFTSCQNYEQGYYTGYQQMANDDVDLVFHLGDYIYEYQAGRTGKVRTHQGDEIQSLDDYRIRLSQYRSDPLLHGMHAACPWMVTWDDHELDNNWANEISEEQGVDPLDFMIRRTNAFQAYYEMMPLRRRSMPTGPDLRLYRKASFGRLAELIVLDTRQYRTDQPNNDRRSPLNADALDKANTLLGREQRGWLYRSLLQSQATWNVLAQQVMMALVGFSKEVGGEAVYSMDQWPGYAAERMQLGQFLADRRVPNPVVLTGDIHSNWANELRVDDRRHDAPVVATELVCTSMSSSGDGYDNPRGKEVLLANNPGVKFHNARRGYVRCTLTPRQCQADFVQVDRVTVPDSPIRTRQSFVIEAGDPRLKPA